ncbi:MAG: hypothetical protein ABEH43_08905, partial [Flavobacteriales bacterium]
ELPIYSRDMGSMKNMGFTALKLMHGESLFPDGCFKLFQQTTKKKGKFQKMAELMNKQRKLFNFSDGTSFEEMKWFAEEAERQFKNNSGRVDIVMIGHSKSFGNPGQLDKFLHWMDNKKGMRMASVNEVSVWR